MKESTQEILEHFYKDITIGHTIHQVSKDMKKPYPFIHKKVQILLEENILKKKKIGHAHLCKLNLSEETTKALLSLIAIKKKKQIISKTPSYTGILETLKSIGESIGLQTTILVSNKIIAIVDDDKKIKKSSEKEINFWSKAKFLSELQKKSIQFKEISVLNHYEKYFDIIDGEINGED